MGQGIRDVRASVRVVERTHPFFSILYSLVKESALFGTRMPLKSYIRLQDDHIVSMVPRRSLITLVYRACYSHP